jgi:D-glycero-alpha-D-manno-heptose-7-phosphate kinase
MIISRTPFRLPLGGGGTDLPSYYSKYGGLFISGSIDKYMHIILNKRFEPGLRLSYSKTEIVDDPASIEHPSAREALRLLNIHDGIEIVSLADAPANTGLGSSGSFTVGLLNVLYAYKRIIKSPAEIAEEACNIAMNKLGEPSGKQDEYVASFGGIRSYEIATDGRVTVTDLNLPEDVVSELENNMMMFYSGIKRSASEVLNVEQKQLSRTDGDSLQRMHEIKRIGVESRDALKKGDLRRFGELLHEHWTVKRGITTGMTNNNIDFWYSLARENGALGGKLVGAGGGGFLIFYCDDGRQAVRAALARHGLREHRFRFDFEGSKVIQNI